MSTQVNPSNLIFLIFQWQENVDVSYGYAVPQFTKPPNGVEVEGDKWSATPSDGRERYWLEVGKYRLPRAMWLRAGVNTPSPADVETGVHAPPHNYMIGVFDRTNDKHVTDMLTAYGWYNHVLRSVIQPIATASGLIDL